MTNHFAWPDTKRVPQAVHDVLADVTDSDVGNSVYLVSLQKTVTLRDAASNSGALVTITNTANLSTTTLVTVAAAGSDTIIGAATWILAPRQSITLASTGVAAWKVMRFPSPRLTVIAVTANYAVARQDLFNGNVINCTTGSFTVTLPSAASNYLGNYVTIKNTGAGTITLATTSSQTIDGAAPGTLTAGQSITVVSDGANWLKTAGV